MSKFVRHPRPRLVVLGASASLALLISSLSMPVAAQEPAVNPAAFQQSAGAAVDEEIGLIPELSTATSNTYRESDGSMRLESFTEPVNYLSESDEWVPIDNELVPAAGAAYEVMNAGNSFEVKIPTDPSSTPVRFATDDAWVTMRMYGLDDAPTVDGEVATFDDVAGADEVTYEVTNTGLKEDIVLDTAPSPGSGALTYIYSIDASAGITPELNEDGSIEFRDSADEVAVVMPAAYMFDSALPDPATSHEVGYDLVTDGAGWKLTVTPSMQWLQDAARVYPVTIDPSLGQEPASKDCWIRDTTPTGSNCGDASTYVKVGRSSGPVNYRGLLDFDTSSIPTNATVTSADVPLYLDHTQSTSAVSGDYALFRAGGAWSGSSATWNSSGASGAWVGGDPGGTAYGTLTLNGSTSGFRIFEGNLKDLVQGWVSNPSNKTGLVLKQAGTATLNVLSFYSSAPAASNNNKRPRLNVTYSVPAQPTPQPIDTTVVLEDDTSLADLGGILVTTQDEYQLTMTSTSDAELPITIGVTASSESELLGAATELLTSSEEDLNPDEEVDGDVDDDPTPIEADDSEEAASDLIAAITAGDAEVSQVVTSQQDADNFAAVEADPGSTSPETEKPADPAYASVACDRSTKRWWPHQTGNYAYFEWHAVADRYRGHIEMKFYWRAPALHQMLCQLSRPTYEHEFRTNNYDGDHIFAASNGQAVPPDVWPQVSDWATNMPSGYLDSVLSDSPDIQQYAVGTHDAQLLKAKRRYFVKMHTYPGNVGVDGYNLDTGGVAGQVGTHEPGCWLAQSCIFGEETKILKGLNDLDLPKYSCSVVLCA